MFIKIDYFSHLKYLGNRASTKVKQKIVEMLYVWSFELKMESKIAEAYQMLKRQGVVIEDPVYILNASISFYQCLM